MLNESFFCASTKAGTAGGFLTILLINIATNDILKTILLAAIGAVVSFVISLSLRAFVRWWKR
ncbi:hypothetical protein [Ferruginibacter sp. HRS2-29]|uniref:hypothetical protein n=1 Tax=Ferruginibacter sp. HRS2-29 TaxID=2487334 RepID=UPI0020CEDA48|nr:hypothetical protein [Ferruginibacter sp. HRS2-29]MCP9749783.1 hypothetical protein [Ferruginibacter sp. HRS2-29]